jgi:hypothetical protein
MLLRRANTRLASPRLGDVLYLDTSVLVHYFHNQKGQEYFHELARHLISKIQDEIYRGILSDITITEFIVAERKFLYEKGGVPNLREVDEITKGNLRILLLESGFVIRGLTQANSSGMSFENLSSWLTSRALDYIGTGYFDSKAARYRFIGMNTVDLFHLRLAGYLGASWLATTDNGFAQAGEDVGILILQDHRISW